MRTMKKNRCGGNWEDDEKAQTEVAWACETKGDADWVNDC